MADKANPQSKTSRRSAGKVVTQKKTRKCNSCPEEATRTLMTGFGPRGFFWRCEQGHLER
jgi:hypothetical protein